MGGLPPSAKLIGIGFYIGITIVLFTVGGIQLDKMLESGKLFTVAGLAIGLFLALFGAYQQLMEVLKEIDERRRKAGK